MDPTENQCKNIGSDVKTELGYEYSIACVMKGYKLLSAESFLNMNVIEYFQEREKEIIRQFLYKSIDYDVVYLHDLKHGVILNKKFNYEKNKYNVYLFDTLIVKRYNIYYALTLYLMWRWEINSKDDEFTIFDEFGDYINGIIFGYSKDAIKNFINRTVIKSDNEFEFEYGYAFELIQSIIKKFKNLFDIIIFQNTYNVKFTFKHEDIKYETTISDRDLKIYNAYDFYNKYITFINSESEQDKIIEYAGQLRPIEDL